ncbi:hypothetical protein BH23CHL2_BH23CHL2_05600 [soil metagenome]
MDQESSRQLEVLREIDRILSREHMRYWLRGGWAIDFLLGRVTRPHADLDLVAWQRHRRRIERALIEAGFQVERELEVQTDLVKNEQDVTFVYLERAADGSIVARGVPEWVWQRSALPDRHYCLHGIRARVVSPEHMLEDQETWEEATGRPPRPKDARTKEILRDIIRTSRNR